MDTDYTSIRGCNYIPSKAGNPIEFWRDYCPQDIRRELEYAHKLGLNSVRIFLSYVVYEFNRESFLDRLRHFVQTAYLYGLSTVPVLWDSCFSEMMPSIDTDGHDWYPNPGVKRLGVEFYPSGEEYCRDIVTALRGEPGLLMWDIHNEPLMTDYIDSKYAGRDARIREIWQFVQHFAHFVKSLDSETPITVGVHKVDQLLTIGHFVDVLSFHDYSGTEAEMDSAYQTALMYQEQLRKPVIITEIGCPARANPYDIAIQKAQQWNMGYYIWELMIGKSFWKDRHGVVYPDGSVRDPSIIAALLGFFRNRGETIVSYNANAEGSVQLLRNSISQVFDDIGQLLPTLERMAHLLEANELCPMCDLPSRQLMELYVSPNLIKAQSLCSVWMEILAKDAAIKADLTDKK